MKETTKAMRRRWMETASGAFNWNSIFSGNGIDLGAGNDPLPIKDCIPFDQPQGDINKLTNYFQASSFDFIHASQSLEDTVNPKASLEDWGTCLRPGGYIVVTVPDFDLYEKRNWPSRYNAAHRWAWSTWRRAHPGVPLIYVPELLIQLSWSNLHRIKLDLICTNFDWQAPDSVDQTIPEDGAEAFIEFVVRKGT